MSVNNLININLNQTVSRFELIEIQKEKNRWYILSAFIILFIFILSFNFFILDRYNHLISSRINKANELLADAQKIRQKYESYDLDVSISQSDIDKLHSIESERLSLANKLQLLAFDIPDNMSLLDLEYNYSKNEMIIVLTSETENNQYEENISLLNNNLETNKNLNAYSLEKIEESNLGIFGDSDFNSYDLRREKANHKQKEYYRVILTLNKN